MNALKTVFVSADSSTLNSIEDALAEARHEGAPDHAAVTITLGGIGPVLKAEWTDEEPDYSGPPADTRPAPVQAEPVVQPDGLIDETPGH